MTDLQRRALASVALSAATVEDFWDGSRSGTAEQRLRALCISHERLRAELQGAEILLAEQEENVKRLQGIIEGLSARVVAQSELLSQRAEKP